MFIMISLSIGNRFRSQKSSLVESSDSCVSCSPCHYLRGLAQLITYFLCSLSSPKNFFLFLLPSTSVLDSATSVSSITVWWSTLISWRQLNSPWAYFFFHNIEYLYTSNSQLLWPSPLRKSCCIMFSIAFTMLWYPVTYYFNCLLSRNLMFQLMTATFVNMTSSNKIILWTPLSCVGPPSIMFSNKSWCPHRGS